MLLHAVQVAHLCLLGGTIAWETRGNTATQLMQSILIYFLRGGRFTPVLLYTISPI